MESSAQTKIAMDAQSRSHELAIGIGWPLLPQLVVPLLLLPPLLCLLSRRREQGAAAEGRRAPPGPPKQLPVLGNLLQIGSRPHRYFQAVARRYGPVVEVQLGRVRTVVVSSPDAAKEVLRTNDLHCCSRPNSPGSQEVVPTVVPEDAEEQLEVTEPEPAEAEEESGEELPECPDHRPSTFERGPRTLSYDFLDVAFSPYSDYWREMRKLFILELLSMRRVQSFAYARAAEVDRLVSSLATGSPPGAAVDLSEKLYALSDGVVGTVAFGKMYGSAQFERSSFQRVMDETLRVLGSFTFEDFFPASRLARLADVLTGAAARRRLIFRQIDRFFDSVIDKHLEPERLQAGVQEDMVDALVKMWREEQADCEAKNGLTRDHIKGILMDTFSGGIDTCAVTMIWIMAELMRNPRVMRKAQAEVRGLVGNKPRVDEEDVKNLSYLKRFEGSHVDFRGSNFELLPFGSGRRSCPAIAMGVANVELALANLLHCFDWQLPSGMKEEDIDMEETGQLAFRKMVPLCLVPIKRV